MFKCACRHAFVLTRGMLAFVIYWQVSGFNIYHAQGLYKLVAKYLTITCHFTKLDFSF
jgi:hypothetical protein